MMLPNEYGRPGSSLPTDIILIIILNLHDFNKGESCHHRTLPWNVLPQLWLWL